MGALDGMDTLAILRGIITAWSERVTFDRESVDVPVPLGVLMRCADEIAVWRDLAARHGNGTIPSEGHAHGRPRQGEANDETVDSRGDFGNPQACSGGDAAEGNRPSDRAQSVVRVLDSQGSAARRAAR